MSTGHVYYSVRAGHVLPGPGVVRAIRKRGDQWVVVTAKGVISANGSPGQVGGKRPGVSKSVQRREAGRVPVARR